MHDSIKVLIIDMFTEGIGARGRPLKHKQILSMPGAFFDAIDDIMSSISALPILFNWNCFHKRYSMLPST